MPVAVVIDNSGSFKPVQDPASFCETGPSEAGTAKPSPWDRGFNQGTEKMVRRVCSTHSWLVCSIFLSNGDLRSKSFESTVPLQLLLLVL